MENSEKGYQIHSIWYTIQGEGPFAGLPAIFVRFTGCHYCCVFCDTVWDDEKDPYLDVKEVALRIRNCNKDNFLVILTGGEPCRWDLTDLIEELHDYQIQVETAGSHWQQCLLNPNVTIVCSPKTSKVNPKYLQYCDHWKYVVTAGDEDPKDGLPVEGTQRGKSIIEYLGVDGTIENFERLGGPMARPPKDRKVNIYLQPCDEGHPGKNEANMKHMVKVAMKYGYRAGLQLHKIFGVE